MSYRSQHIGKQFIFWCVAGLLLLCFSLSASAKCESPEYRQFDFWLGKWTVTAAADGKLAGYSQISRSLNDCVIHEHYKTDKGFEGNSYNIFDRQQGIWHQSWVDNSGLLLQLDGGLDGDSMVLQGKGIKPDGNAVVHRITWTPSSDGTVRQHWQMSSDQGQSWTTIFDGIYTKA